MKNGDRIFGLTGLAKRADKIADGAFAAEKAVKGGKASLVIMSEDTAKNTAKKFEALCSSLAVPLIRYGNRADLGACVGKEERCVIAVLDEGFSRAILQYFEKKNQTEAVLWQG